MAYELKDEQGSLWANTDRKTDSHPNARGQAKIGGVVYWVDAWTNTASDGRRYQTLKFKPKDVQAGTQTGLPAGQARAPNDEPDDEIPF